MENNSSSFDWRNTFLRNWHFQRVVRMFFAIVILYEAFQTKETIYAIAGGLLFVQSAFNWGCCGVGACSTNPPKKSLTEVPESISFEEVKVKGDK